MSFVNWMNMSMLVDVSCVVMFSAVVWKMRSLQKQMQILKEELVLTIKNPSAAKRRLKKNQ